MAETLQLAGTTGRQLFSLTLEDLVEAEELGISEDHAQKLLAAVLAEAPDEPELEPEPEPEGAKPAAALRTELEALKLGALNKRAMAEGVEDDAIEAAMDSDDPKQALVSALLAKLE